MSEKSNVKYTIGNELSLDSFLSVYRRSTLGKRRPVEDLECMRQMLDNADLIVSAWVGDELIGISRTITDFCYVAYLSDLAVDVRYQKMGVGREMLRRTRAELGSQVTIVLLAAPAAREYYGRVGFEKHESSWVLSPGMEVL